MWLLHCNIHDSSDSAPEDYLHVKYEQFCLVDPESLKFKAIFTSHIGTHNFIYKALFYFAVTKHSN